MADPNQSSAAARLESDVEAPASATGEEQEVVWAPASAPPITTVPTAPVSRVRVNSEVSFADASPMTPAYTADLPAPEGVGSSAASGLKGSTRDILMPELPDEDAEAFEEKDTPITSDPVHPRRRGSNVLGGTLRDLTAQLMATQNKTRDKDRQGLDGATRGTAVDHMADTAEMLFRSKGDLPDGVLIDSDGRPMSAQGSIRPDALGKAQEQAKKGAIKQMKITREHVRENRELFMDFVRPRKKFIGHFWWIRMKCSILPGAAIAALLFYVFGNPPYGKLVKVDGQYVDPKFGTPPENASVSWWILFIFVRQVLTFSSAKMSELFLIDFLAVKTRLLNSLVGPYVSLWIAQSKGWPFQAIAWGIANIIFLCGSGQFANHWGYWQDWIELFNQTNPSGDVLESSLYRSLILICIGCGAATAVKRIILSNVMGKRLVVNYGEQLEQLMEDLLIVSKISSLSKRVEKGSIRLGDKDIGMRASDFDSQDGSSTVTHPSGQAQRLGSFSNYQSWRRNDVIMNQLEEWDEPESQRENLDRKKVTIAHLLHFRRALTFIDAEFPFSEAFGSAKTRALCVESSQKIFERLEGGDEVITFDAFIPLATDVDGNIDRKKMRAIWKLLGPSRKGTLTKLEFVKSIDNIYKRLRTLIASIESSSQIEQNYENIVNALHYALLFLGGLAILGEDVRSLIASFGAFFIGIGFIIGNACSKFLEGLLMIFIQKPYNVGDRIAIGIPTTEVGQGGQSGWIVEKVNLYSTTIRFATTREVATIPNGTLATTRITNLERSTQAVVYINLKFGIDVPGLVRKVDVLKNQVKEFVDARPREWVTMSGFRMTEIQADLGYVAYIIILQHVESWQNIGVINTSKAEVSTFTVELSKKLGMGYRAPPLPVDISLHSKDDSQSEGPQTAEGLLELLKSKKAN